MSRISLSGDAAGTGTFTIASPNSNSNFTLTLPTESGTIGVNSSPAGTVIFYAASAAPSGFLKANGAAISRTAYASLFAAIGTTFGVGDGSTTFNVPDMRGYFPRGWVDNGSIDSGRVFGSTQTDQNLAHTHTTTYDYLGQSGGGGTWIGGSIASTWNTMSTSGGTEARPKNLALLACIKF